MSLENEIIEQLYSFHWGTAELKISAATVPKHPCSDLLRVVTLCSLQMKHTFHFRNPLWCIHEYLFTHSEIGKATPSQDSLHDISPSERQADGSEAVNAELKVGHKDSL